MKSSGTEALELGGGADIGMAPDEAAHLVQFYEDDAFLRETMAHFVGAGLGAGDAAVVIATQEHRDALAEHLQSRGMDLTTARESGRYVALDAAETLSMLMVDGHPDRTRFAKVIGGVIAQAGVRSERVRAFGEMVAVLWAEGQREAAIRLEELWDELAHQLPFTLLCAYPLTGFGREGDAYALRRVCNHHTRVIPTESYTALTNADSRLRAIAQLQQRARALGPEVAQRKEAERELQERNRELMKLYEVGQAIAAELDSERLLQAITDAATQLSGAKFGAFFCNAADDQGAHTLLYAVSGTPRPAFDPRHMPRNAQVFAPIFAGTSVVRVGDMAKDPRYGEDAARSATPLGHLPVTSYLAVPVLGRTGEIFGGLFLGHPEPDVFTDAVERVVVALAAQASIAIDNARLYEAERRTRGAAEAANRAKDEFLAMLGHELRNPLSAVRNAVVAATLDASRREDALQIARRGTDQLVRLVDDLLDVARITQGRITLRKDVLALAPIVERAIDATRPALQEQELAVTVSLPANELRVDGDAARLEQVIGNLLSNAAKYTEPGGRITVSLEHDDAYAVLRVRDTGIGISAQMLPRVFDLFAQADQALDRAQGGLGIGLTLVKRLVELHAGRVEAHSDGPGKGAEFVVRLPAMVRERRVSAPTAGAKMNDQRCAKVLIVEDNADAAESMTLLLELLGHHVRAVGDGPSALQAAHANPPDVMLVDIGLPGMDGYEVARCVRQSEQLRRVILVALTGYGREEDRQRALAAGFDYHLVKPVDVDQFQGLVAQLATPATHTTVH